MNDLDRLIPIAALIPAVWLLWVTGKSLASSVERTHMLKAIQKDPVLFFLCAGLCISVIGFLVWIGTDGRVPFGKSLWGIAGFGFAGLIWHESYSRKRN